MIYVLPIMLFVGICLGKPNRHIYEKIPQVDIDEVLQNDDVLLHHFNCVMERSGCPDLVDEIKLIVPEIIQTNCGMCTEEEKAVVKRVSHHVMENKPEMWKEFAEKYDPEGKFNL
ncbi:hypothetical protein WA026_013499 [Henosepilachna vigintioctopunctata]|uniref:Uncharacterized protein n=1 Tax=Henosepilachna vigintioctopunctata TaxID=420089 RepID=A0AAW1VEZ1_9CUCU